jgi:hypothetical protein
MELEKFLTLERARLNLHLPTKRISLEEALSSSQPQVPTRSGSPHFFDKRELEILASLIPREERKLLRLPILIAVDRKLGRGAARISGKVECEVIAKILGKGSAEELILYRPEVAILRRKFPTTTQYMFRL